MMETKPLKNCPFCGSCHVSICPILIDSVHVVHVKCQCCEAKIARTSIEEAVTAWNQRCGCDRCDGKILATKEDVNNAYRAVERMNELAKQGCFG